MVDLLICRCQSEEGGCEHNFITNDANNLSCPYCGSENIEGTWKKAFIFNDIPCSKLDDDFYSKKLQKAVEGAVCIANEAYDLKKLVIVWFKEKRIEVPKSVSLKTKTHFDFSEEGDKYLHDVVCFGNSYEMSSELSEELRDFISRNTTISCIEENLIIDLSKNEININH